MQKRKIKVTRISVKKLQKPKRIHGVVDMNPQCRAGGCC